VTSLKHTGLVSFEHWSEIYLCHDRNLHYETNSNCLHLVKWNLSTIVLLSRMAKPSVRPSSHVTAVTASDNGWSWHRWQFTSCTCHIENWVRFTSNQSFVFRTWPSPLNIYIILSQAGLAGCQIQILNHHRFGTFSAK